MPEMQDTAKREYAVKHKPSRTYLGLAAWLLIASAAFCVIKILSSYINAGAASKSPYLGLPQYLLFQLLALSLWSLAQVIRVRRTAAKEDYSAEKLRKFLLSAIKKGAIWAEALKWLLFSTLVLVIGLAVQYHLSDKASRPTTSEKWATFSIYPMLIAFLVPGVAWLFVWIYRAFQLEKAITDFALRNHLRDIGSRKCRTMPTRHMRDYMRAYAGTSQDDFDLRLLHLQNAELLLCGMAEFRSFLAALSNDDINRIEVFDQIDEVPDPTDTASYGRMDNFQKLLFTFASRRETGFRVNRRYFCLDGELDTNNETGYPHWQDREHLVHGLFCSTNPGHHHYFHGVKILPLQHTFARNSGCGDMATHYEKTCTEMFFFCRNVSEPILRVHAPSMMSGEKFQGALVIADRDRVAAEYRELMEHPTTTVLELTDQMIEDAMFRKFPHRLAALAMIRGYWEKTEGPILALDVSMLQNNLVSWSSDSFYQLALGWNLKVTDRWRRADQSRDDKQEQASVGHDHRFVRVFLLRRDQLGQLRIETIVGPLGGDMRKTEALEQILVEQLRARIDVRIAVLEDLLDHGLEILDFNYVKDLNYAVGLSLFYHRQMKKVALHPFFEPVKHSGKSGVTLMNKYYEAFLSENPAVQNWRVESYRRETKPALDVERLIDDVYLQKHSVIE